MSRQRVLIFDAGLNIGDNLRAFGVFKAFAQAHPELEISCWISPEVKNKIGSLIAPARAVGKILEHPRLPKETYRINHQLIKYIKATGKPWKWSSFPGGKGPDNQSYASVIPTGEPWFSAKLLCGQGLEAPETINQGRFLADILGLEEEDVDAAGPLLGTRSAPENYLTVGLCRPDPKDPKQLPQSRRKKIWELLLDTGLDLVAVDYQEHSPPPDSSRITDLRLGRLEEKVSVLNKAAFHVGSDGGLIHFAAACGCPTLGFYAGPGREPGLIFGPWPRQVNGERHVFAHSFDLFLEALQERSALL